MAFDRDQMRMMRAAVHRRAAIVQRQVYEFASEVLRRQAEEHGAQAALTDTATREAVRLAVRRLIDGVE